MLIQKFMEIIDKSTGKKEFFTGVPDSQLKSLCNYLIDNYGISNKHIIAANEGNATALAAGYFLSTGKTAIVYMQNSGIGNIINPVASLLNDKVYGIPCVFIVGWRGEPNIKDEPQHIFQGEVTLKLLEDMDIKTYVFSKETSEEEFCKIMQDYKIILKQGKSIAIVVKKDALKYDNKINYANAYTMKREEIIEQITMVSEKDIIVSTTGKASRELFEIREKNNQSHKYDFLTVGSMGHSSSIALGIALNKPNKKVWCIDGDGAALMHMGAIAVVGKNNPNNFIHIVINNGSHETVGGMPTVASEINLYKIAADCGYKNSFIVYDLESLKKTLQIVKNKNELCFVEIKSSIGAREDLGRPTLTAKENRDNFMQYLNEEK